MIDSLRRSGLAPASDLRVTAFDLNPRVIRHLEAIVKDSQTDEWLDRDHVLGLLERLARAEVPSKRIARQVWEVLVFMIWHGIFVEERIRPEVPEPVYPVRL